MKYRIKSENVRHFVLLIQKRKKGNIECLTSVNYLEEFLGGSPSLKGFLSPFVVIIVVNTSDLISYGDGLFQNCWSNNLLIELLG